MSGVARVSLRVTRVGRAGLSTESMSVEFSQHEVVSDITNTHMFTSSAQTDFTFVRDVEVALQQVRADASAYLKFAVVELTVPPGLAADAHASIIAPTSLRASVGYTRDTASAAIYPCVDLYTGAGQAQIDAVLSAQSDCAIQHAVCAAGGATPVGAGDKVVFVVPLHTDWWSEAELDNAEQARLRKSIFLDFVVSVQDAGGARSLARMQTQTPVSRLGVASLCERVQLQDGIADLLRIDVLLGLAESAEAYADSVVEFSDITRDQAGATLRLAREASSTASNIVTLIVTGDDALFTQEFAGAYSLEIEDLSSVHIIDEDKNAAVSALLASGGAFSQRADAASYSVMRFEPTPELLMLCPVQQVATVRGCATRRDVRERLVDFTTQAVLDLAPTGSLDLEAAHVRAGAWLQQVLGESDYVRDLGEAHSRVLNERFALDRRYRRAFVLSPTTPWSRAQRGAAGVASVLDLAQHTVFSFMVALDRNEDASAVPTVELSVPAVLEVSADELLADEELQQALETSYADAVGVEAEQVTLDEESVVQFGDARRRMLAGGACSFNMKVALVIKDQDKALEHAQQLREDMLLEDSTVTRAIIVNLNTRVRALRPKLPAITSKSDFLPPSISFPAPERATGCSDKGGWEREVTSLLGLGLGATDADGNAVTGWVSCAARYYKRADGSEPEAMRMPSTGIRGVTAQADWQRFYDAASDSYPHVTDPALQEWHWEWWDLCGDPPLGRFHDGTDNAFARAWAQVRAEAQQQCCMCHRKPLQPGTFAPYVQAYSWPIVLSADSDAFLDYARADTLLVNTQVRNFANRRSKHYALGAAVVPPVWAVEAGTALTVTTACGAGAWEHRPGACKACPAGTFRAAPGSHVQNARCVACPAHKTSPAGSAALAACVCAPGFAPDGAGACAECPASTYKDAGGDWACIACPAGSISSPGATARAACVTQEPAVDSAGRTRLYVSVLGALMHSGYVEPAWASPAPAEQDNARMCAVSADGTALNCPGATHAAAFGVPLVFSSADDTLARVEYNTDDAFQRRNVLYYHGAAGYPCRVVFYLTPEAPQQFTVDGVDRPDLKRTVNRVGFKLRPHYMGPAPPGLTERVLDGAAWPATTVLTTTLRALVPGGDLAAPPPAQALRLVQFVSSKRLETAADSTDWRWVLCGQHAHPQAAHAFEYSACTGGADPDNAQASNVAHQHVLDLRVFELSGTDAAARSCFHQHWWLEGCDPLGSNTSPDAASMFDGVLQWEPAIPAARRAAEQLWVYSYFMLGDSLACLAHNCDEAAAYTQMPAHLAAPWESSWDTELQLLPGTLVTHHERDAHAGAARNAATTPLFDTAAGTLRPGGACGLAGGDLTCTDLGKTRAYPGLYAAHVDAAALAAGVPVAPVTTAVPHAPVVVREVCDESGQPCADAAVADVAARMPALGIREGSAGAASIFVRRAAEVPCGDPCPAGQAGYQPECTQCGIDTFSTTPGVFECTACPAYTHTGGLLGQTACVCIAGFESDTQGGCLACTPGFQRTSEPQCVACATCAAGERTVTACAADGSSPTVCAACQAFSDSVGGSSVPAPCPCDPGFVLDGAVCRWTPTVRAEDPTAHAFRSVERLYPPAALRADNTFASPDEESPDVHQAPAAAYAAGRYAVAYSSVDTAPGYTGYGPYNALGDADTASWAPAQYLNSAYVGTADLTGTLPGEWLALELPVAIVPTRVVLGIPGLDPAAVAYAPHHFALFGFGAAGTWVKLHEAVLSAASYTHTLEQAGDSHSIALSGDAAYHTFALVVPTVGASADALALGPLQLFGHEKYTACPAGTAADAESVCQAVAATTSSYAVTFATSLPLTEAAFDAPAQTAYRAAVADVAGVDATAVGIDSTTALAAGALQVDTSVQAASHAAAVTVATTITVQALNTALAARSLPQASILEPATVAQNACRLAGFHISGTTMARVTV